MLWKSFKELNRLWCTNEKRKMWLTKLLKSSGSLKIDDFVIFLRLDKKKITEINIINKWIQKFVTYNLFTSSRKVQIWYTKRNNDISEALYFFDIFRHTSTSTNARNNIITLKKQVKRWKKFIRNAHEL